MDALSPTDYFSLTCTRSGSCCHGHRIGVTAWEIALLARELGLTPAQCRERHIVDGGTRLRFTGPPDQQGRASCTFFSASSGCTVHPARPLACRLYPLARRREQADIVYSFAGGTNPCLTRCPDIVQAPMVVLGEWLAGQDHVTGSAVHDIYGNVIWGLLVSAGHIVEPESAVRIRIAAVIHERLALDPAQRAALIPTAWFDLITIPELAIDPSNAISFAEAHAVRMQQALGSGFAVPESRAAIAELLLTVAVHLAPTVGLDPHGLAQRFAACDIQ